MLALKALGPFLITHSNGKMVLVSDSLEFRIVAQTVQFRQVNSCSGAAGFVLRPFPETPDPVRRTIA